jgi:hypothetical protein
MSRGQYWLSDQQYGEERQGRSFITASGISCYLIRFSQFHLFLYIDWLGVKNQSCWIEENQQPNRTTDEEMYYDLDTLISIFIKN